MKALRACALALAALCVAPVGPAAAQTDSPLVGSRYDPRLQFRVLSTARADIYFHQGEDALARRLARIVDEVVPVVDARIGAPRGRLRVILVDQTDESNGWATVVPYNLIEIAAVPPRGASIIGNTDDWLRLVFTHEYTHVAHLAQSGGWFRSLQRVFGRLPVLYPNLFLPDWQIEGLATHAESAITGSGRVPAGDFRMILDTAAASGRFAPLDRATSGVIDWPGGASSYLYGAYFHQYLAERFGAETFATLASATGRRLPFTGSRAFQQVYGESLGDLWRDFERDVAEGVPAAASESPRVRLTDHGYYVTSPAYTRDGRLFYSTANRHDFPTLMERLPDGGTREVTSRFYGNRLASAGNVLVFDQLELDGHVALFSDLYAHALNTGATRRLTRAARAADPDVAPDGRTVVCTVQAPGHRGLATFTLPPTGEEAVLHPLIVEEATEFASPRWSPDGRLIAAERRRLGGQSEIVVIDAATRAVRIVTSSASGRNISPMWLPDGASLLFSSDRDNRPFTLYRVDIVTGNVTAVEGAGAGAQSAALSPDGARLVFVGYSADGYDLYSLPFTPSPRGGGEEPVPAPADQRVNRVQTAAPARDVEATNALPDRPYTPWATLAPRFWLPYIETDGDNTVLGAATGGFDALGRHTYAVSAGWTTPRHDVDAWVDYAYTRWWPALFVGASDDTDTWREGTVRARELTAGVLLPWRQVRWSSSLLAAASVSGEEFACAACDTPALSTRRRQSGRVGFNLSNARAFGYSISAEQGAAASVITEFARGSDGGTARTIVTELRGYAGVWPRHAAVAARLAGAVSRGDDRVRREFSAAGSGPQSSPFDLGIDAVGLLRGFDADAFSGRSALSASLDYRFPIAWPQRGVGTWPVFLRAVHGAFFADAAHAWDGPFRRADVRRSFGGELSADLVLGGTFTVTAATGAAWRVDPQRRHQGGALFLRLGRAF